MSKDMVDTVIRKAFKKWGTSKTYLVFFLGMFGAGAFSSAAITFIPDQPDPDMDETQNAIKSTKSKKENA